MNLSKKSDRRFWLMWAAAGAVGSMPVALLVDYSTQTIPANYKCGQCGAMGCKLWRLWEPTMPKLLCCDCAAKVAGENIGNMDEAGRFVDPSDKLAIKSDNIGSYVPAVPHSTLSGYWNYTEVPDAGCRWWRRLPNRPVDRTPVPMAA